MSASIPTNPVATARANDIRDEQERTDDLSAPEVVDQSSDHQDLTDRAIDVHDIRLDDIHGELLRDGEIERVVDHEIDHVVEGEQERESDHRICLGIESCLPHGGFGVEHVHETEHGEQDIVCELDHSQRGHEVHVLKTFHERTEFEICKIIVE